MNMLAANRLIMVEGIPGSGKTTTAGAVRDTLLRLGLPVKLYLEGDFDNPVDFAWTSAIPLPEYASLLVGFPDWSDLIDRYSKLWDRLMVLPYMKMKVEAGRELPQELIDRLASYEPYDGRTSAEIFQEIHLKRYVAFTQSALAEDAVYVFESNFLQNQVNELLAHQNLEGAAIVEHLKLLCSQLAPLNPLLIYLLQEDVERTIARVAKERVSHDKSAYPDWIDHVIGWMEASAYCQLHGLKGYDGTVEFFRRRREIELTAIRELPCETAVFENNGYDVAGGLERITTYVVDRFGQED